MSYNKLLCYILLIVLCVCPYINQATSVQQKVRITVQEIVKEGDKRPFEEIAQRLDCYDTPTFKEEYAKLPIRMKLNYIMRLNIDEYERLLKRFSGDDEWHAFWKKQSDDIRVDIPTWSSQMELVRDCYYDFHCQHHLYFFQPSKGDVLQDIKMYKKSFHRYNDRTDTDRKFLLMHMLLLVKKMNHYKIPD